MGNERIVQTKESNYQDTLKEDETEPLVRIQKSVLSIAVLFFLFLFIDSPVTVIGWILLLGIAAFLAYIIIQIHAIKRNKLFIDKQRENDL
jgi:hypothetical protein